MIDYNPHSSIHILQSIRTPERIRTSDKRFRKPLLYPSELRGRVFTKYKKMEGCARRMLIGGKLEEDCNTKKAPLVTGPFPYDLTYLTSTNFF